MSTQPLPITQAPLRKLVRVPISIANLAGWLKQDVSIQYKITHGLPTGAKLELIRLNDDKTTLVLFFSHESFDAVQADVFVPEFKCIFESLEPAPAPTEPEEQPDPAQD